MHEALPVALGPGELRAEQRLALAERNKVLGVARHRERVVRLLAHVPHGRAQRVQLRRRREHLHGHDVGGVGGGKGPGE